MSERPAPALVDALALLRSPRGPRLRAGERLPEGVLQLIRVVAGEEEALAGAAAAAEETPETVREAATFYIQQVLFAPTSDSFRVLGVDSDAEDERIREHYRWLARWLHPDRNPDAWEVVFAERVNKAWQDLRTSERRQRYQQAASSAAAAVAVEPEAPGPFRELPALPRRNGPDALPGKRMDLRWLPNAIFGSLAIIAVAGLLLIYAVRMADSRREAGIAARAAAEAASITPPQRTPVALAAPVVAPVIEQAMVDSPPAPLPPPVASPIPEPSPIAETPPARTVAAAAPLSLPPPKPAAASPARVVPGPVPRTVAAQAPAPRLPAARVAPPVRRAKRAAPPEALAVNEAKPDAPVPPSAPTKASAVAAARIGARDANHLLNQFSHAYESGDMTGMRAMFAADARGPRGGVDAILSDYNRVFESSTERTLNVRDVSWFVTGDTLTIIASFEATIVKGRAGKERRSHGDLRLDLRRENDQWYIYRLQHDERPG